MPAIAAVSAPSVGEIRAMFPALSGPTVRLDGPAGSQIPRQVIVSIAEYLATCSANLGGVFAESLAAARLVERARERSAAFFGTPDAGEVGFGLNASTVNAALVARAAASMNKGDEVGRGHRGGHPADGIPRGARRRIRLSRRGGLAAHRVARASARAS